MLKLKWTFNPLSAFFLVILLTICILENVDGSGGTIWKSDEGFSMRHNQTAHPFTFKKYGERDDINEFSDLEKKMLNNENANLRQLITEINAIIQKQTDEFAGLKNKMKLLEDESKRLKDELAQFKAKFLKDEQPIPQLHLAARCGDEQAVQKLIEFGADINAPNSNSETPIVLVAESEVNAAVAIKIIKSLIERGADGFATDSEGQTFLHKIPSRESPLTPPQFHDLSSYLVSQNLTGMFNVRDTAHGRTPLMLAAVNLNLEPDTLSLLHENGVDFTLVDMNGKSALFYATEDSNNQKLLASLLNLDTVKLAEANYGGNEKLVKLLINLGADVNETSTFLHVWIEKHPKMNPAQFNDMATFLVSKGLAGLFNTRNYFNSTPFQLAVARVEVDRGTLSLLKSHGVDFNAVNVEGWSVLFYATEGNRTLRLISDLVDFGANTKHINVNGWSMLHMAAWNGNVELVKFFLDNGLDVNAKDKRGLTPLHSALAYSLSGNALQTVQLLLQRGAKADVLDGRGKSPRYYFDERRIWYRDADAISTCLALGASC